MLTQGNDAKHIRASESLVALEDTDIMVEFLRLSLVKLPPVCT